MTASRPPRLATALLHRVFADDEPLVGDLLEGFERHHSRLWFWKQTLSAIVFRARQPSDHTHPLGLAPRPDALRGDCETLRTTWAPINLSASPLMHTGGLGLVIFITLTAVVRPHVWWWLFGPALAGGIVIAIAIVVVRRRHERS